MKFTNANIVATKTKPPEKMNFVFYDLPKSMTKRVYNTLKTHRQLRPDSFVGYEVITDNGNTFAPLFSETVMEFRKKMVAQIPSRVLIN